MTDNDAVEAGVDAAKEYFEVGGNNVGHGLAVGGEDFGAAGAFGFGHE